MSAITAPLPKIVRILIGVLCTAVATSAVAMIAIAAALAHSPAWILIGFEAVVVVSAVTGVLFCFNRFQEGQGLALLCTAGTFAFAAFCTWLSLANHELILDPSKPGISFTPVAMARVGAGVLIALVASFAVLRRDPRRSGGLLLRGFLALLPVGAILMCAVLFPATASSVMAAMPGWLRATVAFVGGIGGLTLFSVGLHCIIRAFEAGRLESPGGPGTLMSSPMVNKTAT